MAQPSARSDDPEVIVVVGATGTGKSDLAMDLAERLDGEIVNTDSMQFYRGMDIGTAKVPLEERRGIPHHLIDHLDIHEDASVAEFQAQCQAVIEDIHARGRRVVLVGGSGLYVRAAVDVLEFPPTDPAVRARLEKQARQEGVPALQARLAELDPDSAARVHDERRVIRALEVIELTGRTFTSYMPQREYVRPAVQIGLSMDRPVLHARLACRVEQMYADGLLDEVRALEARGLSTTRTASRAIGYPQALSVLSGESTQSRAIEDTTTATRQFARRQETWFRADPRVLWLPAGEETTLSRAVESVARAGT